MATGKIKAKIPNIEAQTITIQVGNVVLNQFKEIYNLSNLNNNAIHLFFAVASHTAASGKRYLLNFDPGGQVEFSNQGSSSAYSCVGFSGMRGTGSNYFKLQYYATATPTSAMTIVLTHITIPI